MSKGGSLLEKKDMTARDMLVELLKKAEEWWNLLQPVSLDKLAKRYSLRVDEMILKAEREERLRYVGGQLIISFRSETGFAIAIDLYFQNQKKEWVRMQSASGELNMRYLNEEARQELRTKKKVAFEIDEPKRPEEEPSKAENVIPFTGRGKE